MKKFLSVVLCVLWIGFIFYNSSNNGIKSNYRSNKTLNIMKTVYRNVKKTIKKDKNNKSGIDNKIYLASNKPKGTQAFQNYLVRRGAHAFEYCVLAILISNAFYQFKVKGKRAFIYIIFFCLFTAVLDEFYQSFVPGRTSAVADVLLDFTGSIFGTFLSYVSFYRKKLS